MRELYKNSRKGILRSCIIAAMQLSIITSYADGIVDKKSGLHFNVNEDGTTATITFSVDCTNDDMYIDTQNGTFVNYTNLSGDIKIPSYVYDESGKGYMVTTIGPCAFANNNTIKTITFSKNITTVTGAAFYKATKLEEVFFNQGFTTTVPFDNYGGNFFLEATSLKRCVFPSSFVNVQGGYYFRNSGIEEFQWIPDEIEELGTTVRMIATAKSLKKCVLGANIRKISYNFFSSDESLKDLVLLAKDKTELPEVDIPAGQTFLYNTSTDITLHVMPGMASVVKRTSPWNKDNFTSVVEDAEDYIMDYPTPPFADDDEGYNNGNDDEDSNLPLLSICDTNYGTIGMDVSSEKECKVYVKRLDIEDSKDIYNIYLCNYNDTDTILKEWEGKDLPDDGAVNLGILTEPSILVINWTNTNQIETYMENTSLNRGSVRFENGTMILTGDYEGKKISIYALDGTIVYRNKLISNENNIYIGNNQVVIVSIDGESPFKVAL